MNGPHALLSSADLLRFWQKVNKEAGGGCWLWTASVQEKRGGYGQFRVGRRMLRAHKITYALLIGAVPEGLVLDHLCRVPRCVNPLHLEPVTHAENIRRGEAPSAIAVRTDRCVRGHAFTDTNTLLKKDGRRECRSCANEGQRARRRDRSVLLAADPTLATHGHLTTYTAWGCRCEICRSAAASHGRDLRARKAA